MLETKISPELWGYAVLASEAFLGFQSNFKYTYLRQFVSYYQISNRFRKLKHVCTLSGNIFSFENFLKRLNYKKLMLAFDFRSDFFFFFFFSPSF